MHAQDGGEDPQDADQEERIDEEEVSGGVRHTARNAKTFPLRVDERNDQRKQREEQGDNVPVRRPASISVPYSHTTAMGTTRRLLMFPGSYP